MRRRRESKSPRSIRTRSSSASPIIGRGNIRELQNIIERSVILCTGDTFRVDEAWFSSQDTPRPKSSGHLAETLQTQEKGLIEAALAESNGKVAGSNGAAARLGIPRSTLVFKIKQLNIKKH